MCRQFFVVACLLLWMSGIDPAFAVADRPQVVPAPDLRQLHAVKADLGVWDDVLSHPDWDIVVLRRKNDLFKLCLESPFDVSPLATVRGVAISQIVAGIQTTDRFWIFVCSHDRFPAAIDLLSGDTVELVVPGVQLPCRHSPRVRAALVLEHVGAALLSVGSGCRESWPRVENRPVYFSLNLTSGELVQFPVGWDLWAFSADMTIARFGGMTLPTRERAWHAIDLRSGEVADWVGPNAETERTVAFHWSRTQRVQPVSGTSQERHITGLFVNGQVIDFSSTLPLWRI